MPHHKNRKETLRDLLNDGEELTFEMIRERVGDASDRQISRWINDLRSAGDRVEERREQRRKIFFIPEEHRHHPIRVIQLDEEQILALSVAARAARAVLAPTPLHGSLSSAFDVLLSELSIQPISFDLGEEGSHWHFGAAPSAPIRDEVFHTLRDAITGQQSVLIDYFSASSGKEWKKRHVDPYSLAVRGGSWMLVAWCHQRHDVRDFSLADITAAELCDPARDRNAYFDIADGFDLDAHFRDRFVALSGEGDYVVRLLVEADRAQYFRRKEYHPTQQIEEEHEDGRIVVSYEVSGLDEIRCFAQGWGVGVTVIEPEELVERMRREAEEMAQRYRMV